MKLLYAEDEEEMSEGGCGHSDLSQIHRRRGLRWRGSAFLCSCGTQYDGIILDVMMPKKSGLQVLKELRAEGCKTPILLLTAKAEVEDRIEGLDLRADDYLPKPFVMGELLARVRAMLRRREEFTPNVLTCGGVSLNQSTYTSRLR